MKNLVTSLITFFFLIKKQNGDVLKSAVFIAKGGVRNSKINVKKTLVLNSSHNSAAIDAQS